MPHIVITPLILVTISHCVNLSHKLIFPFPFTPILPPPLSSGNHPFGLYFYESVFALFAWFVFSSTNKWNHMAFVSLGLTFSLSIIPSKSTDVVAKSKTSFFQCCVMFHCVCVHIQNTSFIHSSLNGHWSYFVSWLL